MSCAIFIFVIFCMFIRQSLKQQESMNLVIFTLFEEIQFNRLEYGQGSSIQCTSRRLPLFRSLKDNKRPTVTVQIYHPPLRVLSPTVTALNCRHHPARMINFKGDLCPASVAGRSLQRYLWRHLQPVRHRHRRLIFWREAGAREDRPQVELLS